MEWDTGGSEQGRQEYESTDDSASFLCFESRILSVFPRFLQTMSPAYIMSPSGGSSFMARARARTKREFSQQP